mgnify:CR=1 FL=1
MTDDEDEKLRRKRAKRKAQRQVQKARRDEGLVDLFGGDKSPEIAFGKKPKGGEEDGQ